MLITFRKNFDNYFENFRTKIAKLRDIIPIKVITRVLQMRDVNFQFLSEGKKFLNLFSKNMNLNTGENNLNQKFHECWKTHFQFSPLFLQIMQKRHLQKYDMKIE